MTINTYYPEEMTTGLIRNPGMGWVLYCDAFGQMTDENSPDMNKGVMDAEKFWKSFDDSGATDQATTFYLRAPWSYFEPEEGKFAWDHDENYRELIQHALDKGLRLSFRVCMDSQDSYQQATPDYVREQGAKGYINTFWNPYINDAIFVEKYIKFIKAFGEKYNDAITVDFIDAMGLGAWGEGHNIESDSTQSGDVNTTIDSISKAYRSAFDEVLLGAQQGGALMQQSEALVHSNQYDVLRRDSFGMPQWYKEEDKDYYVDHMLNQGIPLFAENGWNYFAHDFKGYMGENGNPFSNIRDMLESSMNDVISSRANTFDFRVPEDAIEWMKNQDLVDEFTNHGGYRFVPTSLTTPTEINSNDHLVVESEWKNTGIGRMPNNRKAWDYRYNLAFALLDPESAEPVFTHVTDIDPSAWLKGNTYKYESNISFGDVPDGTYDFAYGIVDTMNNNKPTINLAITDKQTISNWYKVGQTTVLNLKEVVPLT